ncbi:C40 family peptidase [Kineococcus sp. SYSU DK005]|uniref:C40 family peptidase n=1 Tax=Kineococcus sp. SYSU DK005 TaxID=3383126 RepID=UPI003D7DB2B8
MAEGPGRRALLVAALGALPLLAAAPAHAQPLPPGPGEVEAARAAAAAAAARVAALQAELGAQQQALEDAHVRLSVAAEDYDEAAALLRQRSEEAERADGAAAAARAALAESRLALGRFASRSYRATAGDLGPLATVLGARSAQDVLDRSAALERVAAARDEAVDGARGASAAAGAAQAAARDAAGAQQRATDAAAAARAAAEGAAAAADALLAATRAREEQVLAELAALQDTSVLLERRRLDALAAEEQVRREAAARAEVQGSGAPVRPAPGPTPGADAAVARALAQLGKPYRWGGEGPDAFDCSGLVLRAWEAAGVALPHSSRLQRSRGDEVALADLRAGDLVFYATDTSDPATVHHVGLVVAPGLMVEAPHSGAVVRTASIYRSGLLPLGTRPR